MATSRKIADKTSDPGGKSGDDWTQEAGDSIEEIWNLNGGILSTIAGTNALVGTLNIDTGFTAYTDGFRCSFIAPATNTGSATLDLGIGVKPFLNHDGGTLVAGDYVLDRLTHVVFVSDDDAFRLASSSGTVNLTVEGGIILQRSVPTRLVVTTSASTSLTSIGTVAFQCEQTTSRVAIEGNNSRVTGAGTSSNIGTIIALFVDTVQVEAFTDHCQANSHSSTSFSFEYEPGDISSHDYEIRVSSTIAATHVAGGNWLLCNEFAPNA